MNYLLLFLAAVIGALVVALRMQGGSLHALQVEVLRSSIAVAIDKDDKAIEQAMLAYEKALNEYHKAKDE